MLERITSTVDGAYEATLRGAPGAVQPSSLVAAVNLHTGHYSIVPADAAGAFETRLFAAGGSSILIKSDPSGGFLRDAMEGTTILGDRIEMLGLAGTVIQIPDPANANGFTTMSGLSPPWTALPVWVAEARTNQTAYQRGEPMSISGTLTILGNAAQGQTPEVDIAISLVGVSRADGSGTLDQNTFCSTLTTPTGLPIEHPNLAFAGNLAAALKVPLVSDGNRLRATFDLTVNGFPNAIGDGHYRPLVMFLTRGIAKEEARRVGIMSRFDTAQRRRSDLRPYGLLPVVRIGNPAPPRLHWTLLANTFSQGARGVTAIGDRDRFGVSSRIATPSDRFVIPRVDPHSGTRIHYDLEPFALTVAISNHSDAINPPTIPFRFPSGNLTVTIETPSGAQSTIGPAPFRQARLLAPVSENGEPLDANYFTDAFQLTTLDPRFQVAFAEDGVHEITVSGSIVDLWGNVWSGGGTYVVDVARTLEIDSAVIPGTPLVIGDSLNPSMQLLPAVPADVEVRYRFAERSRRDAMVEQTLRAKASPHGYVHFDPIALTKSGEYRVDIYATYRDPAGRVWSGTRTWGGVVAAATSPVILHGKRGVDDQPGSRLPWFSRKQIGLSKSTGGHVFFPFHSGDVQWMEDGDAATIPLSIHDPSGLITPTLLQYCCAGGINEDLIRDGESPFYSIGANGVDPHVSDASQAELWAYAYRAVERPRVRIREMIGDEAPSGLYWRFDDRYALQSGTGAKGDLPNDFKFQFGASAMYGKSLVEPIYSIYGSLFVLVAPDDAEGTRVFPPFQGNGGGPSGGPLFTLKGREVEMFFHPTAVRPGTILEPGTIASFSGQVAPTLAANVEIIVTSPSGVARTIAGRANTIGYFFGPAGSFAVDEPGVWRARVRTWHEGTSSAGQLTPPFPTGDVLGSRDGEHFFYVASSELHVDVVAPGEFKLVPPDGLRDVEIHYTTTMPGFILEEGTLDGFVYRYDATRFAADFPNLEPGVDTITISFLLSGTAESGARRHSARMVTLQGDEIQIPSQPPPGRRRSVRN